MISIVNGCGLPVVFCTYTQYVTTPVVMQQVAAQQKKVGDFTALFAVGGFLVLKRSSVQKVHGKIMENSQTLNLPCVSYLKALILMNPKVSTCTGR